MDKLGHLNRTESRFKEPVLKELNSKEETHPSEKY